MVQARARSEERISREDFSEHVQSNAQLPGAWLRENTHISPSMEAALEKQIAAGQLSLRGLDKVLRLSWSVADVHGHSSPTDEDIAVACMLRGAREEWE